MKFSHINGELVALQRKPTGLRSVNRVINPVVNIHVDNSDMSNSSPFRIDCVYDDVI